MITMHQLFDLVLGQKDLSRAGDLFSLDDFEIESSLSDALEQIKHISSLVDYQTNDNDQAVVEICITRITTAIRETESIEKHGKALVQLWESCLEHNLKSAAKDEDTPHGKIASDIMSCILQNYNRPIIMSLAVPVAVKFLQRGDKELCRNLSNYISLAAIAKADLLAKHTEAILSSILQGNSMLLRVLPSVYEMQPHPINQCLRELVLQMPQLEGGEQHHMLRLLQEVAKRKQPKVLTETLPVLMEYVSDPSYSDIILNIFYEISAYEPLSLAGSLSTLKDVGDNFPCLVGQIAKIYGAVGHADETMAKICLTYLVNQLTNMEHSFHHILLLEIRNITGTFNDILGRQRSDMCRMSNSFTAIAKILQQQLGNNTAQTCRTDKNIEGESAFFVHGAQESPFHGGPIEEMVEADPENIHDQSLMNDTCTEKPCMYADGKTCKEDKIDKKINRSKLLALNAVNRTCLSSSNCPDTDNAEMLDLMTLSHMFINEEEERLQSAMDTDNSQSDNILTLRSNHNTFEIKTVGEPNQDIQNGMTVIKEPLTQYDKLFLHLKEHNNELKNYVLEMVKTIPVPDQCIIEEKMASRSDPSWAAATTRSIQPDTVRSCAAKLFFSCPMKGHYCLYSKSSFTLISQQPQLWIHIMFLFRQSLFSDPTPAQSTSLQVFRTLWEKTQLKGTHSFEASITQSMFPLKKDLELVHMHLEEVRFFDLFGFSEETGSWQCFMCNNPEKATVVNQEGQPLIEGKLKEKQVRWKFIKRWKTRYFTLAGNQLLFRKGKSKDDPDDSPIELSKVQSVKAVTKKRRDRGLPRAFEIFTDNKTYVFKAKDEKNAEEWLQCINVAVAQAKERESREATTYL